ncbi:MAG: recombination-associated protein RdgC [Gammaproteobacteria bacterium]|nr:recombination-associated protein RdgC [Gammaproteobacteria bacterium]
MWFKNLTLFRLPLPFELDHDALDEALQSEAFHPCGKSVPFSYGWARPLGRHGEQLVHTVGSYSMICARKEERILPSAVVKEQLAEKVEAIEQGEARSVGRKERQQIKDELTLTLLPQAFTRSNNTYAYIDRKNRWLVVDSASATKAEDLVSLLRESLGGLKARLPQTEESPRVVMSRWLRGDSIPDGFELGDEYELQDGDKEGAIVRCRRQDPLSDEIQGLLDAGKQVAKLAMSWQERIEFVVPEDLCIKRLRFTDTIKEELDDYAEDPAMQFDSDFAFMSLELSKFIEAVIKAFGGESEVEPV